MTYSALHIDDDGVVAPRVRIPIPVTTLQRWLFVENAIADPDKPILVDAARPKDCVLSMNDYRRLSQRFAAGLVAAGFERGQRLLIVARNSIYCPVALMGTVMAGGIYCTADPMYDESDLARTITHLEPSIILASPDLACVTAKGLMISSMASQLVLFPGIPERDGTAEAGLRETGFRSWTSLFLQDDQVSSSFLDPVLPGETDETIAIIYSSGTTGVPKGVQISHRNYIAAAIGHMERLRAASLPSKANWNALGALGMHHILGQRAYSIILPLLSITTYIATVYDYRDVLRYTQDLDISYVILRSATVTQIAKNAGITRRYKIRSLRRVEACATGLDPAMRRTAEDVLSGCASVQVAAVWGLTELGLICGWRLDEACTNGSVGELHANYEGRVVLADGSVARRAATVGEIQIRSPSATRGYWSGDDATRALLREGGWVTTGDLGYVDDAGKWFIVDRIKVGARLKARNGI